MTAPSRGRFLFLSRMHAGIALSTRVRGQPGTGKTTIALDFAATVSSGGRWPDGTLAEPGNVVISSGEDDTTQGACLGIESAMLALNRMCLGNP